MVTTADAALAEVSNLLIEAESLAIANANTGGLSDAERLANQMQIDSILSSVNRIAGSTTFAGQQLLDGSATVTAGGGSVTIDSVSTGNLGEVEIDGDTYSLADVATGGALVRCLEQVPLVCSGLRPLRPAGFIPARPY